MTNDGFFCNIYTEPKDEFGNLYDTSRFLANLRKPFINLLERLE